MRDCLVTTPMPPRRSTYRRGRRVARRHARGACAALSDRAIAWLFIAPTIVLLLAINIFPLIWTIQLSFTNYRANRPNAPRSSKCRHRRNYSAS